MQLKMPGMPNFNPNILTKKIVMRVYTKNPKNMDIHRDFASGPILCFKPTEFNKLEDGTNEILAYYNVLPLEESKASIRATFMSSRKFRKEYPDVKIFVVDYEEPAKKEGDKS
jgi:hypothetical protein